MTAADNDTDHDALPYRLGVGVMLLDGHARVLVGQRIDTPGAWQMPQGGLDDGESPAEAAFRELEEEIGTRHGRIVAESRDWLAYDLPAALIGKVWKGRYRGQKQKWFAMRFLGRDTDIDVRTAHPEFDAWKWVEPAAMLDLIVPFKRPLYEAVLEEFAALIGGRNES